MDAMDALRPGDTLDERPRHTACASRIARKRAAPLTSSPTCPARCASWIPRASSATATAANACCSTARTTTRKRWTPSSAMSFPTSCQAACGCGAMRTASPFSAGGIPAHGCCGAACARKRSSTAIPTPTGAAAAKRRAAYARTLTEMAAAGAPFLPGMAQMSCGDRSLPPPPRPGRAGAAAPPPLDPPGRAVSAHRRALRDARPAPAQRRHAGHGKYAPQLPACPGAETAFFPRAFTARRRSIPTAKGKRPSCAFPTHRPRTSPPAATASRPPLTVRLGPPRRRDAEMTIWQTLDADGNLTAVRLLRYDERTLRLE